MNELEELYKAEIEKEKQHSQELESREQVYTNKLEQLCKIEPIAELEQRSNINLQKQLIQLQEQQAFFGKQFTLLEEQSRARGTRRA